MKIERSTIRRKIVYEKTVIYIKFRQKHASNIIQKWNIFLVSRSKLSCANTKLIPMYLIRINKCNACDIIRNLNSNRPIQFFVRSVLDFPSALTQRRVDEISCDLKIKLKKASSATILDRSSFKRFIALATDV